jgi:predicted nucleic acid-binding protein
VIVIADTSVLLNLACIGQEKLLAALYKDVFAPPQVHGEFCPP